MTGGIMVMPVNRTGGFNVGNFVNDLAKAVPTLVNVGRGVYNSYKANKTSGMYRRRRRRTRRTGGFNVGNYVNDLAKAVPTLVNVGRGVYNSYKANKTSGMYRRRRRRPTHGIMNMIARRIVY